MKLLSVNVSPILTVEYEGKSLRTAIYKKPVKGPVMLRKLGLDGDDQADRRYHGGEHMAAYAITRELYEHWRREEHRDDFSWGLFGENLTVEGLSDEAVHIGDRLKIGSDEGPEVEVSLPRGPCSKLGMAVKDNGFPKRFLSTCQVGFYLRVLREGVVQAGDAIAITHRDPARVSVTEATRTYYFDSANREASRRLLGVAALGPLWRDRLTQRAK